MPEEQPTDVLSNMMKSMEGALNRAQFMAVSVSIKFNLKGHEVTVQGMNPDIVINGVEAMKKISDRLTEV